MAEKKSQDMSEWLDAIEDQLATLSGDVARMNEALEGLVKAQLLMGSLVETQQIAKQQFLVEAISNEVIAKITNQMSLDNSLLADQLVGAIGSALCKRDAIALADEAARKKPIEIMWTALSQFQPYRGQLKDSHNPTSGQIEETP